jgi:DNA repair protein RecO (recombination protein O)
MHVEDEGIVLQISRLGEAQRILTCLTRHNGVIKGVVSVKKNCIYDIGALVKLSHKARLESHLGFMSVEVIRHYGAILAFDRLKLVMLQSVMALLNAVMRERDAHVELYDALFRLLEIWVNAAQMESMARYALFELFLMQHMGYGLDLSKCAVSSAFSNLKYVSPNSGRAVSEMVGQDYHQKLFILPSFYLAPHDTSAVVYEDLVNALKLNEFFLRNRLFEGNNMKVPMPRVGLHHVMNKSRADE